MLLAFLQEGGSSYREKPVVVVNLQFAVPGDGPVRSVSGTSDSTSSATCRIRRQEVHGLLLRMLGKQSMRLLLFKVSDFRVVLLFIYA